VALKVKTLKEMNKIMEQVKQAQLPYHTVIDAGKTQIAANSVTVLAIGPAPESMVNQFTGHLKLL
jgi:PTH2 family peptidyl-tRNA hydrolase